MWLLNTENIQLKWFAKPTEVSYAILSHVWGGDEQAFLDTRVWTSGGTWASKTAHQARSRALRRPALKIKNACKLARRHGFRWLWVDTCCIDQANSTELSEAINSMYTWYEGASMCYAYLHDVPGGEDPNAPHSAFRTSVWFSRGWTLQELIAPHSVIFLAQDWSPIGPKRLLATLIERITGVDHLVLTHRRKLDDVSIACRMSWASKRKTTRIEDEAYALMGIFDVYMPTIYGEGRHAFVRLQEEILKKCPDQTIFAWGRILEDHQSGVFVESAQEHDYAPHAQAESLLAPSPAEFAGCADLRPIAQSELAAVLGVRETMPEYMSTSYGIRTTVPLVPILHTHLVAAAFALLACHDNQRRIIALYLRIHPSTRNTYFVGGYIARGGRRNYYYRGAHLGFRCIPDLHMTPDRDVPPMWPPPILLQVHIHADPNTRFSGQRGITNGRPASTTESSRTSSMVFFEPPCTIVLSQKSLEHLRRLGGSQVSSLRRDGIRLKHPGDCHKMPFVSGAEGFTVHVGVCSLDARMNSIQAAQLWATVRFHTDSGASAATDRRPHLSALNAWAPMPGKTTRDIIPEESMFVQSWKSGRATFENGEARVRLSFSYPCSREGEQTDIYELDIRLESGAER